MSDLTALRDAMRRADFDSVRGNFKFTKNQHPVQNLYIREVIKNADDVYTNKTLEAVFTDHGNAYESECSID